jgi:uncharacterized protein
MTMGASIYRTTISHVRQTPLKNAFTYRSYSWFVDVDHLPRLPALLRPLAVFRAADHLGDPAASIRANVERYLRTQGIEPDAGPIHMLTSARVFGYVFNPLTLFWCYGINGELRCVVAEVHNTYGERHCYLLVTDEAGRARVAKDFYVSPFLAVDGEYRMHLPVPDERLSLAITLRQNGSMTFVASVAGVRTAATPRSLVRMVARRPLVTLRTSALIRRHGAALWLRRLPVIPRPRHAPQEGVQ